MRSFSFQSRGVQVEGWRDGEGLRVLATHGWLDNANTWKPVASQTTGIEWCSIDFPGHGRSAHIPSGETYHFVDNVEVVLDAADALGWDRFSLVGHSMGGSMAMMFAAAFPERVEALVLSDSFGPLTGPESEVAQQLRMALISRRRSRGAQTRFYPEKKDLKARMLKGNPGLSDAAADTLLERSARFVPNEGWAFSYDRRCRDVSPYRYTPAHVTALMGALACPTLLIRATEGGVLRYGSIEEHLNVIADLTLVEVPGNHHVHLNEAEKIAPIIEEYLQSLSTRTARS